MPSPRPIHPYNFQVDLKPVDRPFTGQKSKHAEEDVGTFLVICVVTVIILMSVQFQ